MASTDGETRLCIWLAYLVLGAVLAVLYTRQEADSPHSGTGINLQGGEAVYGGALSFLGSMSSNGSVLLDLCLQICSVSTIVVFVVGELTGNLSQLDKLWSVLPVVYVWVAALISPSPRLSLMCFVSTVWGVRLTYNFNRRGGYSWPPWKGDEDYRWEHVRTYPIVNTRLGMTLFNVVFISIYQNILLFLMACPAIVASASDRALSIYDWLVAFSVLALIYIETVCDDQQFAFQTEKWRRIKAKQKLVFPYSIGFPTHGLFHISRHPNYAAEMSIWFVFYLFTLTSGARLLNWSLLGAVLLCQLFQGSTKLSESISSAKYESYKRYVGKVDRFLGVWNPLQQQFQPIIKE